MALHFEPCGAGHRLTWAAAVLAITLASSGSEGVAFGEVTGSLKGKVSLLALSVGARATDVTEVLVYIEEAPAGMGGLMPKGPFSMVQKGRTFQPRVLVVPVGATVTFPNLDRELHNVFSLSPLKAFDLSLYQAGELRSVLFDKPGIIPVFCNIHPQMSAHVIVVNNPLFSHPDASGAYELKGIPEGTVRVSAWHRLVKPVQKEVTIIAGRSTELDVILREVSLADRHTNKLGKPYAKY